MQIETHEGRAQVVDNKLIASEDCKPIDPTEAEIAPPPRPPVEGTVTLEIPLTEIPPANWSLHIDAKLTAQQSHAIRRVTHRLQTMEARLASGVLVNSHSLAIRWILEQIP
jgi:hypothetical protein